MKRVLLIPLSIPGDKVIPLATPGDKVTPLATPGVKVIPLAIPGVKVIPLAIPGVKVIPLATPGVKVGINCIDELIVQIFKLFTFTSGPDVKSIGELIRQRLVCALTGGKMAIPTIKTNIHPGFIRSRHRQTLIISKMFRCYRDETLQPEEASVSLATSAKIASGSIPATRSSPDLLKIKPSSTVRYLGPVRPVPQETGRPPSLWPPEEPKRT
jgi:hypothetical protein